MSTFCLPHIARAVHQPIRLRRSHLPRDRFHLRRSVMVDMDARLEEIEANSRLRQEAAAEQADRRKKHQNKNASSTRKQPGKNLPGFWPGRQRAKTSKMLPPVAAVLPAEKGNETLVKWGLLPCCRFSGPLSINMTFVAIFDHLSLRPSGLKGRSPLRGANPFHRKQRRTCCGFFGPMYQSCHSSPTMGLAFWPPVSTSAFSLQPSAFALSALRTICYDIFSLRSLLLWPIHLWLRLAALRLRVFASLR